MTKSSPSYLRCKHCNRQYFNRRDTLHCPHCGHRVRWSSKYLWVWVTITIAVVLVTIAMVELATTG